MCLGDVVLCDDGDPCTVDGCVVEVGGCVNVTIDIGCDDKNSCMIDICEVGAGCSF